MIEFRLLSHRHTALFRVGGSGWAEPAMLGILLKPGTHHVYEDGKEIGYVEIYDQTNAIVHLKIKQGRVV